MKMGTLLQIHHNKFWEQPTVDCLDASAVVVWELEVFRVKPLVKGGHDGRGVIRVLQTQSMTQLMDSHQENIITFMQIEKNVRFPPGCAINRLLSFLLPPWSTLPVVQGSARSKCVSPPMPFPGKYAWARKPPSPSNGVLSPWKPSAKDNMMSANWLGLFSIWL